MRPTDIYVREALEACARFPACTLINIPSDALLNLARVAAPVGFALDSSLSGFPLIQRNAKVKDSETFEVF